MLSVKNIFQKNSFSKIILRRNKRSIRSGRFTFLFFLKIYLNASFIEEKERDRYFYFYFFYFIDKEIDI
jgi:hypothetical protein